MSPALRYLDYAALRYTFNFFLSRLFIFLKGAHRYCYIKVGARKTEKERERQSGGVAAKSVQQRQLAVCCGARSRQKCGGGEQKPEQADLCSETDVLRIDFCFLRCLYMCVICVHVCPILHILSSVREVAM